jgi:sulfhydrogenase subunit beta (sulfur reductase)
MKIQRFLPRDRFQTLLGTLRAEGYEVVGPQVRDHALVFAPLSNVAQLPTGIRDHQAPGHYRLEASDSPRCFDWAVGPQALKPLTFPGREILWHSEPKADGSLRFEENIPKTRPTAVLGVRACDLAGLLIHDHHFVHGDFCDPYYLARRKDMLLIAVHCTRPASTCFCAATGDGPRARYGFDLALSELDEGFILEAHTDLGTAIMDKLDTLEVTPQQLAAADTAITAAAQQQRGLPDTNLPAMLQNAMEHPQWQQVAQRCLACGNCTAVCPTCFCQTNLEEVSADGTRTTHYRHWESCFSPQHSYIHGITIRAERPHRYRQWLSHKFGTWVEQYGRSGCVGCGRCISWCPVGIDVTAELAALCKEPRTC